MQIETVEISWILILRKSNSISLMDFIVYIFLS